MMREFKVVFTQEVTVKIDETKLDQEFMGHFKKHFYDLDTIEEHAEQLAQMQVRSIMGGSYLEPFMEGYGVLPNMGISIEEGDFWAAVESEIKQPQVKG